MEIAESIADLRAARARLNGQVGLVPTMGALHEGHLALVRAARQENDCTLVTIFVNPIQFNNSSDLAVYPRDTARDLALLREEEVDLVFMPAPEEVYPPDYQTYITVEQVSQGLEGAHRPGHFRGVATIVAKLFNLTQPQRAYFGQKDAQQIAVIQQMAVDLNFPLEIVKCPTVRAPDGLALSSRNRNLSQAQRQAAAVLYRALQMVRSAYEGGERDAKKLRRIMRDTLTAEPLAEVEYVSVADAATLKELDGPVQEGAALVSLAVRFGQTRLIDNIILPG